MHLFFICSLTLIQVARSLGVDCPCGWLLAEPHTRADNPTIRLNAKYDWTNVKIKGKHLVLRQRGYSQKDREAYATVSIAGIQSRQIDMRYGTYRAVFKVEGSNGGACAGFFWYRDDRSEIDIELITKGTSLVNNTVSFTSHPSRAPDGSPIPGATLAKSLSDPQFQPGVFREYRFDSHPDLGVAYYVDGKLIHKNTDHVPKEGGNLQLKLWADGNKWWSGTPSTTDVFMTVASVVAYYNTSIVDPRWLANCTAAGGPSKSTLCTI
ncbi:hypothetical protein CLAIMM_12379 [Cladophialophora immunda]|nr:hypothetical protein CLAIMM_12379 [Cladophialophora immunda]